MKTVEINWAVKDIKIFYFHFKLRHDKLRELSEAVQQSNNILNVSFYDSLLFRSKHKLRINPKKEVSLKLKDL